MFRPLVTGGLLACITFIAWGSDATPQRLNTEFQITCPGRPTMAITTAQYGLTTVMWSGDNFQIAVGEQQSHTDNGVNVTITRFRNGDQMIVNQSSGETYFSYNGGQKLVPCSRTGERENDAVTLQRTDSQGHIES